MKDKKVRSVLDMTMIALFAGITAVLSQLAIPMPSGMPVTMQIFAVALCGFYLGTKKGVAAIVVYILLGAIGVPVFTRFKGGPVCLFYVTGGFIWGFLVLAAFCGIRFKLKPLRVVSGVIGLLICHVFGFMQYALVMGIDPLQSFLTVSLPFLLKDVISTVLAFAISEAAVKMTAKMTV